jgi:hypothetical protein
MRAVQAAAICCDGASMTRLPVARLGFENRFDKR